MGHHVNLPLPPEDLVEFDRLVFSGPPVTLALTHFDRVMERGEEYGLGFFSALRNLIMDIHEDQSQERFHFSFAEHAYIEA